MANDHTFGIVPVTDILPQRALRSTPVLALGGLLNWLLANGAVACKLFHKGLPDTYGPGIAFHTGASEEMLAAPLRLPTISTAHALLYCRARVTVAGAGNGSISFTTAGGPDTFTGSSAAAGPIDLEDTVDLDSGGDYDDLTIQLETDAATDITVHSVEVWYVAIADPIPAGTSFSGAQAFGLLSLAADNAADAGLNDAFVDAVEHLRDRPRMLACDVAISAAVGGDGYLRDREHATFATLHRGVVAREVEYTFWVNAERPNPPDPARVYLLVGRTTPSQRYPVAIAADGWSSLTFTMDAEGPVVDALPVPSAFLTVWPAPTGETPFGKSTAIIYSYTVWGP